MILDGTSDKPTYYVMPTTTCNLNCSHCDIHQQAYAFDEAKFCAQLDAIAKLNARVCLFGGEPTLDQGRLDLCLNHLAPTMPTISTNLVAMPDAVLDTLLIRCGNISTSWNPRRFTDTQLTAWRDNILTLNQGKTYNVADLPASFISSKMYAETVAKCREHANIPVGVPAEPATIRIAKLPLLMITLTEDLICSQAATDQMCSMLDALVACDAKLKGIQFEHYVPSDQNLADSAHVWLSDIAKGWHWPYRNLTQDRIDSGTWICDCANVHTLYPDGTLTNRCPHNLPAVLRADCLTCQFASRCRPCQLQPCCSWPCIDYAQRKSYLR